MSHPDRHHPGNRASGWDKLLVLEKAGWLQAGRSPRPVGKRDAVCGRHGKTNSGRAQAGGAWEQEQERPCAQEDTLVCKL